MCKEKALEDQLFEQLAMDMNPESSPIANLVKLAQLHIFWTHDNEAAVQLLEKVVEREPSNAWATFWLAFICYRHHVEFVEARGIIEDWLSRNTGSNGDKEARAAIFDLLYDVRNDPDVKDMSDLEGMALLEESVRLAPNWSFNRVNLAELYSRVGRKGDAITQLEAAEANQNAAVPTNDPMTEFFEWQVTGRNNTLLRETIGVRLTIERLEPRIDPDSSSIDDMLILVQLYSREQRWADALSLLERAREREPGDAWALYWLVYICIHRRTKSPSPKRIVEDWLSSHKCNDRNMEACAATYHRLSEASEYQNSNEEIIELLEESVRLAPDWTSNRLSLADAYVKAGRNDDALAQLRAASANQVNLNPEWDICQSFYETSITGRASDFLKGTIVNKIAKIALV